MEPNWLSAVMMVVPFCSPDRLDGDGTGEASAAEGDAVSLAGGEEDADEGPSGVADPDNAESGVDEKAHPTSSRQTRRTKARTLQVCADLAAGSSTTTATGCGDRRLIPVQQAARPAHVHAQRRAAPPEWLASRTSDSSNQVAHSQELEFRNWLVREELVDAGHGFSVVS